MKNDILRKIRDFVAKHYKVAFPVVVIVAVAATVAIALTVGRQHPAEVLESSQANPAAELSLEQAIPEVPLVANEDGAIYSLLATYYNAAALGDTETISQITDVVTDMELLRYQVSSQYLETYPVLDIYTKQGPEPGSTIAYVYYKVTFQNQVAEFPGYQAFYICTNDNGELYIKRGENTEEVNEYIKTVNGQADVVEFNNRIMDEFNELMLNQPELLEYLNEFDEQVSKEMGVILAEQSSDATQTPPEGNTGGEPAGNPEGQPAEGAESGQLPADAEQPPAENTKQYATATTTVNVRGSDSEQADKLGKVSGGTKLEVLENRMNGWSKVIFEGQEGYIKSEYLQAAESAEGAESIGTVTAATNVNVRASASETADKLGVMTGGESAELIANEGEWCKIKYNGQVGYVKAEFLQ